MFEGGPQHLGLGTCTTIDRADLGSAVTAKFQKLPEKAKNVASFGHSNAKKLQLQGFSLRDPGPGALPLDPAGGSAPDPVIGSRSVLVVSPA